MPTYVYMNQPAVHARLAADISSSVMTITLQAGDGAKIPAPNAANNEIALCGIGAECFTYTSNVSDVLTGVVRGVETAFGAGAPAAHVAGDEVRNLLTAGAVATIIQNPLTTAGDLLYGGTAGKPSRLPIAADGSFLKVTGGVPTWGAFTGGIINPMTAAGDLIIGQPTGTTNLALNSLGIVAAASSSGGSFIASNVFDGNDSTIWSTTAGGNGQWVSCDLGAPQAISSYRVLIQPGQEVNNYRIQSSDDNAAWTTRATVTGNGSLLESGEVTLLGGPITARYWRFLVDSMLGGSGAFCQMCSVEFRSGVVAGAPGRKSAGANGAVLVSDSTQNDRVFWQPTWQVLTDGATISWNASLSQTAQVTLGGNRTLAAPTNLYAGKDYRLVIKQDGTGGRTLTWNAVFKWASGTAPTLSTAAASVDVFEFVTDGTNLYQIAAGRTAVTPGSYTSADITVLADGRVSAAANGSGGGSSGATIFTSVYASPPGSPASGDLWLPSNSYYTFRYSGSAWVPFRDGRQLTLPGVASGWTWVNQSGASLTDTSGALYMTAVSADGNNNCAVKSLPVTPYTLTFGLRLKLLTGSSNADAGVCWRDSASGKLITVGLEAFSGGISWQVRKWTNATTFSADYQNTATGSREEMLLRDWWIRLADDGTTRTVRLSADGVHFDEVTQTAGHTDFLTADQYGLYVRAGGTGRPQLTCLSVEAA